MRSPGRLVALAACAALVVALAPTAWAATPGPAYSWGSNNEGRLGTGQSTSTNDSVPTAITVPGQFTSISAQYNHGCALGGDDSAWCWGNGWYGQLGNGLSGISSYNSPVPVRVLGPSVGFSAIAAGYWTSCALQNGTSAAYCWGQGHLGQLGNGTNDDSSTMPVAVSGGLAFHRIDVGQESACAVALDDSAYCWGRNDRGQLGDGTFTDDSVPSAVVDVTGSAFTNRTTTNGIGNNTVLGVYAAGSTVYAATFGGLSISTNGGSTFTNRTTTNGLGNNTVNGVYAIDDTVYAATNGGLAISTDSGSTFTNKTTANNLGSNFVNDAYAIGSTVYAATDDGLAISTDGGSTFTRRTTTNGLGSNTVYSVYATGSTVYAGTNGGLSISTDGGSTFTNRTTTTSLGSNFVNDVYAIGSTVYAGTSGGLSISTDGGSTFTNRTTTNGLGSNTVYGVYAIGSTVYAATSGGLSISTKGFAEVSAGGRFACGVTKAVGMTGPGVCWGWNGEGQLGNGSTDDSSNIPVIVDDTAPGVLTLRSIAAGDRHACAISTDDSAYCWGDGTNGQLGNGSSGLNYRQTRPTRVLIPGDAPVRDISAGSESSCAITDDTTYCWGWQAYGQVGNGQTGGDATVPAAVTLSGIGAANSPVQVTSGQAYNAFIVKPRILFSSGTAFPSTQVGQPSSTTVQVTNNRLGPMTNLVPSVTGAGVTVTGTTCNGALPSGATCTVSLAWAPASVGALSGASLTINYVGNSSSTPLTGTATDPTPPPPPPTFPPGPPGDTAATAGDASATVTWTAPTSPGSFPITDYQVTSSPGGQTCLTAALTCTVVGLSNGTTYTFTVKALSGAGWGVSSAPSNAVTPMAPPPPPPAPSILITGTRDGQRITVTGTARHLDSKTLRPWIKFPGQKAYTEGTAVIPIAPDGTFTWSRKTNKKTYVHVAHDAMRSNMVTIPAR